ncbi:MAG: epoxyqueuosine reductase QueH [Acidobacteriota bacterium]|nr:epoxyqueuosine reductase QueH [Acidobacteriota bacterium]MDW3228899.1 epoxyqueuosine reductase QueH [Acidobacteriota bacterium]MDY0232142.1 epoxyqueuosine reductase QueH [Candidatus Saccharicenans sp.]
MNSKPELMVHLCCAPDALYVIGLLQPSYKVTGFFYNPNIHPEEEYQLRLEEIRKIAGHLSFELIEGQYQPNLWFKLTEKFQAEPEKGRRCHICYAWRLDQTANKARELGIPLFTTVMSISPWKNSSVLNRMGKMIARKYRIEYLEADFKKKDGFNKSVQLSKQFGLYRQNYCGCLYSQRPGR